MQKYVWFLCETEEKTFLKTCVGCVHGFVYKKSIHLTKRQIQKVIFFYSFHKKEAQLAQKNNKYIECMCVAFSALIRMFYEPIPMNMNIKMEIMYKCTHVANAFKAQKNEMKRNN